MKIKFSRHDLLAFVTYLNELLTEQDKRTLEWSMCYALCVKLYKRGIDFNKAVFTHTFTYPQALAFGKMYIADLKRNNGLTFGVARDVFAQLDPHFQLTAEIEKEFFRLQKVA